MKKPLFLGCAVVLLLLVAATTSTHAQQVEVSFTTDQETGAVQVCVSPWQIEISKDAIVQWVITGDLEAVGNVDVHNHGKAVGGCPPFPPPAQGTPRGYGPFTRLTPANNVWCSYNIVLNTSAGEIRIDPDFRVTPNGLGPTLE